MEAQIETATESWNRWARAFREVPWRRQMQLIATLALAAVVMMAVGGIYLAEASRAATAGRDVQSLRDQRDELMRQNEMLRAQIASYQSVAKLNERARQLGFVPATIDQLEFVVVPQYQPQEAVVVAPTPVPESQLSYEESLGDWLAQQVPLLLGLGS